MVADWIDCGLPIEIVAFEPVSISDLEKIHDSGYVRGVFGGNVDNGHGNRSPELAESTRYTIGSMVAAADLSLLDRVVVSPTSGFHHAHHDRGGGFCTFNGLIVAACKMLSRGAAKVGILDCDYHYGDGTDSLIMQHKLAGRVLHWTNGRSDFEFEDADRFLMKLRSVTETLSKQCDVILYQAGADMFIDDPLGGFLNMEELRKRDRIVFEGVSKSKASIVWNLAGGYHRDEDGGIGKVLDIHRATIEECLAANW